MHRRVHTQCRSAGGRALLALLLASAGVSSLPASARAEASPRPISKSGERVEHTFRFTPPPGEHPRSVHLAGDFNGWSPDATRMPPDGDSFSITIKLSDDLHHYKFVVDGHWLPDPAADPSLDEDDGNGGTNSGVETGLEPAEQRPSVAEHTFHFMPLAGQTPRDVHVAGDFNQWSPTATPLSPAGGEFTATVPLSPGLHPYKLVVDGHWITDPAGDRSLEQSNGLGGTNSAVMIAAAPPDAATATGGGGRPIGIRAEAVAFDPADEEDCNVASPTRLRLSFRAQVNNLTAAAALSPGSNGLWNATPLYKVETRGGFDRFGGLVATSSRGEPRYVLELTNGPDTVYVADGFAYDEASTAEAHAYQVEPGPTFATPAWAQKAVWYQIFPERFRNGDPANDPPHVERWTSSWYGQPRDEAGPVSRGVFDRRYGGDLQGVQQELPYLRSLGVNAIYLNPVFQAESLHKYDTSDYRHVDEHFGYAGDIEQLRGETDDPATWQWTKSDKLLLDLVADAHRQGFRVILDGVFNHVGTHFWAFQDVVAHGRASKYAGWFDIIDWKPGVSRYGQRIPFHYKAWDGDNGSLPIFKKDPVLGMVHGPREHILAVAKRWLAPDGDASRGVDGFRLDAAENVPHPFWVEFRDTVKATKPDAYIDGEIWTWAQPWLSGDQFDGVMNYQFAIASHRFFAGKHPTSPDRYADALSALVYRYPLQVSLVNQNLLDSHDTDRVASMFANPDRDFNASADAARYDVRKPAPLARTRLLQEVAVQMTFLGAPMIYYGDEVGMWGATDPADRQPMIWKDLGSYDDPQETFDDGKFEWYQRLIALRQQLPALQTGFFRTLPLDGAAGVLGFVRTLPGQSVYVLVNRTPRARHIVFTPTETDPSARYANWLRPETARLSPADPSQINSRPTLQPSDGAPPLLPTNGKLDVSVDAWSVAVITLADALNQPPGQ